MMGIIVSVAAGKRPSLEGTCDDWPGDSHQMADLMKRCWDQKPKQRPSFAGLVAGRIPLRALPQPLPRPLLSSGMTVSKLMMGPSEN